MLIALALCVGLRPHGFLVPFDMPIVLVQLMFRQTCC